MKNDPTHTPRQKSGTDSMKVMRQKAQEIVREKNAQASENEEPISPEETQRTLFELQVHQIQLEMQNEELREIHSELDASRARYFELYDLAPVGYLTLSADGLILETNLTAATLLGVSRSDMTDQLIFKYIFPEDQDIYYFHKNQLIENGEPQKFELRLIKVDESIFWVLVSIILAEDIDGSPLFRLVLNDITEKKQQQEEVIYLSYHDHLTGLYNRRFYEEELERLDTKRNLPITLIMGDVNGLKLINDSFGHSIGDDLLKKAANIITVSCREDDIITRVGGDEFMIILPQTDTEEAEHIVQRIRELASNENVESIDVSISLGYDTKRHEEDNIHMLYKRVEDKMYQSKLTESSSTRSKTIDVIMSTLYAKYRGEKAHSKRVSRLCEAMAIQLSLDKDLIKQIKLAGLMHDIGKIGIDKDLLNSSKDLNATEWKEIKRHSEIGYRALSSANEFSEIANYVLEHQERWDGKGYPKGLKGEEISLQARIIAVADAFDTMTREKPYRMAMSTEEAIEEIKKCSGTQFDPDLAKLFCDNYAENAKQ